MRATRHLLPLIASLALLPFLAQAAVFPDVPSSHPYRAEIEGLVAKGVIGGNPDGTFRPGDPVNRAAMLKMLYMAAAKAPAPGSTGCFPKDVVAGSWYELYVCDAAAQGYVQGYADGTFKPGRPVSRAEALKMVITVMGLSIVPVADWLPLEYTDVPSDAWFTPYIASAKRMQILTDMIDGGASFFPNEPIDRGEAAAYVWNVLEWMKEPHATASFSSAGSISSAASSDAASSASAQSSRKQADFDDTGETARVRTVIFPFSDTQTVAKKNPFSYRFTLSAPLVVEATARPRDGTGGVTCTLYRLEKDGLSTEYYIGYVEGGACYLRTALTAGDYQLQLQPVTADSTYVVETKAGIGDGSDGFSEAMRIDNGRVRTEYLESNDYEDWFVFTVTSEQEKTLSLVSADKLRCLVYPSGDVDLYGFEGPACNTAYLYPTGTYYVGIGHASPKAVRQTYSIQLK